MKKIICLIAVITLIASCFAGCNKEPAPLQTEPTEAPAEKLEDKVFYDGELYSLERIDGQTYITVKNAEALSPPFGYTEVNLSFFNIDSFVGSPTIAGLTKQELSTIYYCWDKEPSNANKIKVCDFSKLYQPVCPENLSIKEIHWDGENYSYTLSDESIFAHIRYHTEESYSAALKEFNENIKKLKKTEDTERDAIVYYEYSKKLVFELSKDGIDYTVVEYYENSSPYPKKTKIFCEGNGIFFTVEISGMNVVPDKLWYTKFSMEPIEK